MITGKEMAQSGLQQLNQVITQFTELYNATKNNPQLKELSQNYLNIIEMCMENKKVFENYLKNN